MTLTIAQEFSLALVAERAEEDSFKPIIEKFEELKKVLQSNFKITIKERKWYGLSKKVTKPVLSMEIKDKITKNNGDKYLFIRIDGCGYVMGLGKIGELKDRLYFIEGVPFCTKDKTVVYVTNWMFGTTDYCLENKITNVQLFSELIKRYKKFLSPQ